MRLCPAVRTLLLHNAMSCLLLKTLAAAVLPRLCSEPGWRLHNGWPALRLGCGRTVWSGCTVRRRGHGQLPTEHNDHRHRRRLRPKQVHLGPEGPPLACKPAVPVPVSRNGMPSHAEIRNRWPAAMACAAYGAASAPAQLLSPLVAPAAGSWASLLWAAQPTDCLGASCPPTHLQEPA